MERLYLALVEAALETIPQEIVSHEVIVRDARRRGKEPKHLILDRSRHHKAMLKLERSEKRGRPDIIHQSLLATQYSLLNHYGKLKVYIHTLNDYVIDVNEKTRIPKNYNNFIGLMEQLFMIGRIPPKGKPLMILHKMSLEELLRKVKPTHTILLDDIHGVESNFQEVAAKIVNQDKPLIMIGAFPHGTFSEETYKLADEVLKIGHYVYDTWIITCKLLTYIEYRLGLEL